MEKVPGIFMLVRAPFFTSILAPIFVGTLLSVYINDTIDLISFILVTVLGIGLHAATNVYNDIYDTLQGTDKINKHRNEFSGGSGVLVKQPELLKKMFWIARISLIISLFSTLLLLFRIDKEFWYHLIILYLLSAFFSKYYTAAPIKLASRGLGEISVWFAFGPMAVLVSAVSQNISFHPLIISAMSLTGLSTLSILWVGQIIDLPADKEAGKLGLVSRLGTSRSRIVFVFIHVILLTNLVFLFIQNFNHFYLVIIPLLPYLLILPKAIKVLFQNHAQPDELRNAAKLNVQIHMIFSLTIVLSIFLVIILK